MATRELRHRWRSNHTHDPAARSWLASANADGTRLPDPEPALRGVPPRRQRASPSAAASRSATRCWTWRAARRTCRAARRRRARCRARLRAASTLNDFFALGPAAWRALRHAPVRAAEATTQTRAAAEAVRACLVAAAEVEYALPARIGDYTDFYTSIDHALNVGRAVRARRPDDAQLPVDPDRLPRPRVERRRRADQPFHRPMGQAMAPGARRRPSGPARGSTTSSSWASASARATRSASRSRSTTPRSTSSASACSTTGRRATSSSGRWHPLGPFLAKNFATTHLAVDRDAWRRWRRTARPWMRPAGDPQPLPYLDGAANRAAGAHRHPARSLAAERHGRASRTARGAARLSRTSFRHQYWSIAQMVTHHTVGGCNLQPGDLIGSGTISGPDAWRGRRDDRAERAAARKPVTLAATAKSGASSKTATP